MQKGDRQVACRKVTGRWHVERWQVGGMNKGDRKVACWKVTGRWHAERWQTNGIQKWHAVWWRTDYMQKGDRLMTRRKIADRWHAERLQTDGTQKADIQMTSGKKKHKYHAVYTCTSTVYVQYTVGDILMTCRKVTGRWHAERWHT